MSKTENVASFGFALLTSLFTSNDLLAGEKDMSFLIIECHSFAAKAFYGQIFSGIGYSGIALVDQV